MNEVVLVTGLSGAGKSTALHALEDLGFFCVDNTPPPVVESILSALEGEGVSKIALGMDVRVRKFLDLLGATLLSIDTPSRKFSVLFIDATDQSLLRRFSSTRRPHPLSTASAGTDQTAERGVGGSAARTGKAGRATSFGNPRYRYDGLECSRSSSSDLRELRARGRRRVTSTNTNGVLWFQVRISGGCRSAL